MNVLNRLKLQLGNKEYFTNAEYIVFLNQNDFLTPEETIYNHHSMEKQLIQTTIDVLESLANDVDLMRKTEGKFATVGEAYKFLENRINYLNKSVAQLHNPNESVDNSNFSFFIQRTDY